MESPSIAGEVAAPVPVRVQMVPSLDRQPSLHGVDPLHPWRGSPKTLLCRRGFLDGHGGDRGYSRVATDHVARLLSFCILHFQLAQWLGCYMESGHWEL